MSAASEPQQAPSASVRYVAVESHDPGQLRRPIKRRVVQIAIGAAEGDNVDVTLVALCDDSTIWWTDYFQDTSDGWHRLEAVPGTVAEEPE